MAQPTSVLIVDDEQPLREVIADFLRNEGFLVETAGTGQEALLSIERERPGLILLDMYLPVMDGRALIRELRARGIELPIVIMTGAAEARETATEVGAAAYVSKPLALPLLLSRINGVVPKRDE